MGRGRSGTVKWGCVLSARGVLDARMVGVALENLESIRILSTNSMLICMLVNKLRDVKLEKCYRIFHFTISDL